MASPYVGECRLVGFNFAPVGWAICQGQLVPISENETLFNLIGTTYGGDGQSTFQLPDLQGRVPIHQGSNRGDTYVIGQRAGVENVTLTTQQIPAHSHTLIGSSSNASGNNLPGNVLAVSPSPVYTATTSPAAKMNTNAVTNQGGNQPHDNLQPYLTLNWIISLFGIYPTQS